MSLENTERLFHYLERADQTASVTDIDLLAQDTLSLVVEAACAQAGTIYICEQGAITQMPVLLTLKALVGNGAEDNRGVNRLQGRANLNVETAIGRAVSEGKPVAEDDLFGGLSCNYMLLGEFYNRTFNHAIAIPLKTHVNTVGCMQIFDYDPVTLPLVHRLVERMTTELDKALQIQSHRHFIDRLKGLVEFIGSIGSSLDRDQILRMIIDNARELLQSEATSLFLIDDATGESVLKIASNVAALPIEEIRVPAGQGIIGATIQKGEPVQVRDIASDMRHYAGVDKGSGFVTQSILAVPLRTRPVALGEELGMTEARIIGALEAINKIGAPFNAEDTDLLKTLASQAATVLKIAELYTNANELFLDIIGALAAAIDAKDPYTVGHSQRVSYFAVEIAHQLQLAPEVVQQIRIGALLHDIGKIGIPDSILLKPGRLTPEEYVWMKKHPSVGENIMIQVRMLRTMLPCLSEHHEKIDGTGYPRGLHGDQISLMGRIVAVADVFDAITSDRPYRPGMSVDEAFQIQTKDIGTHFDARCVEALIQAYNSGKIVPQPIRKDNHVLPPP